MKTHHLALSKDGSSCDVRRVPFPRLTKDDDLLVRFAWAGLCRTDLYAAEGRLPIAASPMVLGHEASGVVQAAKTDAFASWVGKRVTILPRVRCGACASCREDGSPLACMSPKRLGLDRDGVFAEYGVLPASSVVEVPADLPMKLAAYVEPVAAALAVLSVGLRPSDRGLIYGANRIAELTRRILAARGIEHVRVVSAEDAEALPDAGFDFAIETTATHKTLPTLLGVVRRGGRIVLKSRPFEPVSIDIASAVEKEITLHAMRYAPFAQAIEWLRAKTIDVEDLLGEVFVLARYQDAFRAARREEKKPFFDLQRDSGREE